MYFKIKKKGWKIGNVREKNPVTQENFLINVQQNSKTRPRIFILVQPKTFQQSLTRRIYHSPQMG